MNTHSIVIDGDICICDDKTLDMIKNILNLHKVEFFGKTETMWHRGQPTETWEYPRRKHG